MKPTALPVDGRMYPPLTAGCAYQATAPGFGDGFKEGRHFIQDLPAPPHRPETLPDRLEQYQRISGEQPGPVVSVTKYRVVDDGERNAGNEHHPRIGLHPLSFGNTESRCPARSWCRMHGHEGVGPPFSVHTAFKWAGIAAYQDVRRLPADAFDGGTL